MEEISFKKLWQASYMIIIYQIIGSILQVIIYIAIIINIAGQGEKDIQLVLQQAKSHYNQQGMFVTLAAAIVTIPICLYLYKKDREKEQQLWGEIKYQKVGIKEWTLLILLAVFSCIALNEWISLSGIMNLFPGFEKVAQILYGGNLIIQILAVGIAAPIIEELLFRGLFYKRITEITSRKIAGFLSALFFGIYHFNIAQGIYAFFIGLLFVYVYEKFHTIKAPILFHIIANMTSILLTELQTSYKIEINTYATVLIAIFSSLTAGISFFLLDRKKKKI